MCTFSQARFGGKKYVSQFKAVFQKAEIFRTGGCCLGRISTKKRKN